MDQLIYEITGTRIPLRKSVKLRKDGTLYLASTINEIGAVVSINHTTKTILDLCNGINTIKDIYVKIISMYIDVDSTDLENIKYDVYKNIRQLESLNYISVNIN